MPTPLAFPQSSLAPLFQQCRYGFRVLERKLRGYSPRVRIQVESHRYVAKTVEHWEEWVGVLRLRHEVFHQQAMGRTLLLGMDIDDIDFLCDNLAIFEKATGQIVATYRLTSDAFSPQFYSQKRFYLDPFLEEPGTKLELGRACVRSDARNGNTLALLWKGIAAYMDALGAETLFGSTSIRSQDPRDAAAVCSYLIDGGYFLSLPRVYPHRENSFENGEVNLRDLITGLSTAEATLRAQAVMPPLFQSYLRAGAKVICPPALDPYLGSIDFLTVLRVNEMQGRFDRRYRPTAKSA